LIGPTLFEAKDLNPMLQSREYEPRVDNFMVIIDASGTMREPHGDHNKLDFAKGLVNGMNQTIPDMKLIGALRMFGRRTPSSNEMTELLYGVTPYSKSGLEKGLSMVTTPRGDSPLALAEDAAIRDLESVHGKIALIIFSDGKDMSDAALKAGKAIKGQFGDRICVYTVVLGNDPAGKKLMARIAGEGQCGFSVSADSIASGAGMADFVGKVFLTKGKDTDVDGVLDFRDKCPNTPKGVRVDPLGCPLDTDGDGVYDYIDKCPLTPRGVTVDQEGCSLDSDGDGVSDFKDKCPDTPMGVEVSIAGCPLDTDEDLVYDYLDRCPNTPRGAFVNKVGCWVLEGVEFGWDKWDIKPHYYPYLDEVVAVLLRNPNLKVEIQGHTDSRGSAIYNQSLSEKRANGVMDYFLKRGIDSERLSAAGYGLTRPIASNLTPEGRAQNRRVELKPIY